MPAIAHVNNGITDCENMILGIEASNIKGGGALTHLIEIITNVNVPAQEFTKVIVWAPKKTLSRIPDRHYLLKQSTRWIEIPSLRFFWQLFALPARAKKQGCTIVFVPGGTFLSSFRPFVAMSQNMIPFEPKEIARYKNSLLLFMRQHLLRLTQGYTFKKATGVIFISAYAHKSISNQLRLQSNNTVIHHGINEIFRYRPRKQLPISKYTASNPYRILYISHFVRYKHQWHVARAISLLKQQGYPVVLNLVGGKGNYFSFFEKAIADIQAADEFIHYCGQIEYTKLHSVYRSADLFVFASSCENMPITLAEAMASGLPIACSNRGPMPEILSDAGTYFDPEAPEEIASAVKSLIDSPEKRRQAAARAYQRARSYTWTTCADLTFAFLARCAKSA